MDYVIQLIGVLIVLNTTPSPGVNQAVALVPPSTNLTFCTSTPRPKTVMQHQAFLRITNTVGHIVNASGWPTTDQKPCKPNQFCTLFEIPEPSDITIASGFTTPQGNPFGATYCLIPHLGELNPNIQLMAGARAASLAALDLPGGMLEARRLGGGAIVTLVKVVAPQGQSPKDITITATPRRVGGKARILVVSAGTQINLVNMPLPDAQDDLNIAHPAGTDHEHFFLVNNLIDPKNQLCATLSDLRTGCNVLEPHGLGSSGDPFCSNTGCCP